MAKERLKGITSHREFMERYFPKEYAKRKAEGRCLRCGAKRPRNPPASREEEANGR